MKSFGVFRVEVVRRPKELNKFLIVIDKMILWEVEVNMNTKINKDMSITVILL